jgi:2-desacetyl-2-hydroxyethyl bacteriochlorophyllide A dehydrogenase
VKAVRVAGPARLEIVDLPHPEGDGHVVVRSRTVGICGTDVKILSGKMPVSYPRVMGHEMIGDVVLAPPGSGFGPGDRVLVDPASTCGRCDLCRQGKGHLCRNAGLMGREIDGVFAEYVSVPTSQLLPVPESISPVAAGLLQVLGTCIHAQKTVDVFPGQVAVVIGLGVAGQLMVQLLAERGVTVVGVTRSEWKRDLAAAHGAVVAVDPADAATTLDKLTAGRGPELVVEAAGTEQTLAQSIELAGVAAQIIVFGTLTGGGAGLPYYQLYFKELTLHNPRAALPNDYALGIELAAAGRLDLESIVTHQLALGDAGRAFDLVHDSSSLKVLMHV